jgi:hypothetical protein
MHAAACGPIFALRAMGHAFVLNADTAYYSTMLPKRTSVQGQDVTTYCSTGIKITVIVLDSRSQVSVRR